MTRIPAALHSSMELVTSLRGGSSIPTQPTKVRSVWGEKHEMRYWIHVLTCITSVPHISLSGQPNSHLVVGELGWVLKVHLIQLQWGVTGGQGQATQGVTASTPVSDDSHDLLLDSIGQGNTGGANTHICAPVNHTLRGTLWRGWMFCVMLNDSQCLMWKGKRKNKTERHSPSRTSWHHHRP